MEKKINPASKSARSHYGLKEMLITRFINEGRIKEVFIERCILSSLDHPSIIKFYQSFKSSNKLYLLVEYCPKGSLSDFLKRQSSLNNNLAKHMTAEIVLSLEYLREMQIVHRDLKPGNIVLDSNYHIKLIDFATCKVFNRDIQAKIIAFKEKNDLVKSMGFSDDNELNTTSKDSRHYSLVGTEEYLAPETLSDSDLNYTSDYWSLGVILYQLLCGCTPFKGRSDLETYNNIQKSTEITFKKSNIDPQAKDLIRQLLTKEPTLRIGIDSIQEIKDHPYFAGVDWATLRNNSVPYNPPKVKRPPALKKPIMSSSFSKANDNSPLVQMVSPSASPAKKSPAVSQTSSPMKYKPNLRTTNSSNNLHQQPSAVFGGSAQKEDAAFFQLQPMSVSQKVEALPTKTRSLEESKKLVDNILMRGTLRKKGLIFLNERIVTIDSKGILRYFA